MTNERIKHLMYLSLTLLMAINGILYAYARMHIDKLARDTSYIYHPKDVTSPYSPPVGFTFDGKKVDSTTAGAPGWLVRYASKDCKFCQKDEAVWVHMAAHFQRSGYKIIVIEPTAKEHYAKDAFALKNGQSEEYVNLEWIKQFTLSVTPTVLVFTSNKGLVWSHQGALRDVDPDSALRAVTSANQ
jgi:hypothetical protein